jgi:hypothetical protein
MHDVQLADYQRRPEVDESQDVPIPASVASARRDAEMYTQTCQLQ